jgi:hypothetical protein
MRYTSAELLARFDQSVGKQGEQGAAVNKSHREALPSGWYFPPMSISILAV